jgi:hypothetical protein
MALLTAGFAVPNDIGSEKIAELAKADRFVRGHCGPFYTEPELKCSLEEPIEDWLTPRCALVGLLLFALGLVVGWVVAKRPPIKEAVADAIKKRAAERIAEAQRHGVLGAVPLLEKLRDEAIAAVQALLE